ncbi:MAG TPA: aldo/keto reductase, partial [Nitrospirota bacterium]|nr:aldo/keto reductase [Nitrospirota bacterium]
GFTGMGPLLRFALSQPVTNVVIRCDDAAQLEENVGFARSFAPMTDVEKDELIRSISPYARELMFYKP